MLSLPNLRGAAGIASLLSLLVAADATAQSNAPGAAEPSAVTGSMLPTPTIPAASTHAFPPSPPAPLKQDSTSVAVPIPPAGAPACAHAPVSFRPGQGVELAPCDGSYALQVWARAQLRYTMDHHEMAGSDYQQAAEVRRAALFLAGHAFNPHNKFFAQFVFSPRDLGLDSGSAINSPIARRSSGRDSTLGSSPPDRDYAASTAPGPLWM